MSLDAAVSRAPLPPLDAFSSALASDPAAGIVKHAVKIWARDHGVAEDDISRLTDRVVDFASLVIREHKVQAVA